MPYQVYYLYYCYCGIVVGVFTATEVCSSTLPYLSLIYRSLKLKHIPNVIKETEITGMILFLITASALFSLVMSYTGLPEAYLTVFIYHR